jgi:acetylornithine deacetylase
MTDVVALAAELLSINSSTGSEGGAVDFVSKWLVARGWNVFLQEVTRGRANVWASRSGGGVTLSTHLDTVPPYIAPRLDGDRLRGRGACDAKGIAAAMLVAADKLARAGENRVDLLFVVGEEKGSDGARAANRLQATSKFLVNGEPTESKLASGAKGSLGVTVRTRGRAAHSA